MPRMIGNGVPLQLLAHVHEQRAQRLHAFLLAACVQALGLFNRLLDRIEPAEIRCALQTELPHPFFYRVVLLPCKALGASSFIIKYGIMWEHHALARTACAPRPHGFRVLDVRHVGHVHRRRLAAR